MTDFTLRKRTATEIVDAALTLYRRNFSQYLVVTAVAYAPALIGQLLIGPEPTSVWLLLGSMFIVVIGSALMSGSIVTLGSSVYLGEGVDVAAAMRHTLRRIHLLIIAGLLLGILYFIGFMLLVVGFLYVGVTYFGVAAAIVLEDKSIFGAFGRSSFLTSTYKGHVLGTLALVYILYLLISFTISFGSTLAGNHVLMVLATSLWTIVAYPVVGLTTMVLFYDLRIRREGFDIERMTQQLAGTTPGVAPGNTAF